MPRSQAIAASLTAEAVRSAKPNGSGEYFYFQDRLDGVNKRVMGAVMDARGDWLNIKDWYLDPASR